MAKWLANRKAPRIERHGSKGLSATASGPGSSAMAGEGAPAQLLLNRIIIGAGEGLVQQILSWSYQHLCGLWL